MTIDSLPICLNWLKSINFDDALVFINDGIQSHQVLSFESRTECFEVNGMSQCIEVEYKLRLTEGNAVIFQMVDGLLRITELPTSNSGANHVREIPEQLSKYYF